jgi:hypothetical protein
MTTFDEREHAFEKKYEVDQEVQFKVLSRTHMMLGLWAAGLMGKTGAAAEAYAKEVVLSDFEKPGHEEVVAKVVADLIAAGKAIDVESVNKQRTRLMAEAKKHVMTEV